MRLRAGGGSFDPCYREPSFLLPATQAHLPKKLYCLTASCPPPDTCPIIAIPTDRLNSTVCNQTHSYTKTRPREPGGPSVLLRPPLKLHAIHACATVASRSCLRVPQRSSLPYPCLTKGIRSYLVNDTLVVGALDFLHKL